MKTWKHWTFAAIAAIFGMVIAFTACDTGNGDGGDDDGDKSYKYTPGEIVGTGTSADPFHVHDVITLSSVGKTPEGYSGWTLDAHYKQTANIDLAEIDNWTPIGESESDAFTGSYNGGSYTIKNITINATTAYQGLFGCVGEDGIVKNVGVIDCDISSTENNTGGVVGFNKGIVSNCYSTGNISGGNFSTGGIVGVTYYGTVLNCYSAANVSGIIMTGGVVGYNGYGGTISNCVALNDTITRTSGEYTVFRRVVCNDSTNATSTNNYAKSTMTFIDGANDPTTTFPDDSADNGIDITSTQWSNPAWWTGTAGWDADIWDFSGISTISYPKLR